jgi:CRISPR-associated protein Csh1
MILNNVGFAQVKKEHKTKPILGKLNYNGMNAQAIKRLRIDLFEKCKQYDILKYNEGNFSKFTDLFKDAAEDQWDRRMKPAEALFYLLSGYSFRTSKEVSDVNPDVETDSEN